MCVEGFEFELAMLTRVGNSGHPPRGRFVAANYKPNVAVLRLASPSSDDIFIPHLDVRRSIFPKSSQVLEVYGYRTLWER